jgi:hypothetical protein
VKKSCRIEHGATTGRQQPYSPVSWAVPGGDDAQCEHGQRANSRLKREGYESPANMRLGGCTSARPKLTAGAPTRARMIRLEALTVTLSYAELRMLPAPVV